MKAWSCLDAWMAASTSTWSRTDQRWPDLPWTGPVTGVHSSFIFALKKDKASVWNVGKEANLTIRWYQRTKPPPLFLVNKGTSKPFATAWSGHLLINWVNPVYALKCLAYRVDGFLCRKHDEMHNESSWQRSLSRNVLLVSIINSCVTAHQFAMSMHNWAEWWKFQAICSLHYCGMHIFTGDLERIL